MKAVNVVVGITEKEAKMLESHLKKQAMMVSIGVTNPSAADRLLLKLFKAYQAQSAQWKWETTT